MVQRLLRLAQPPAQDHRRGAPFQPLPDHPPGGGDGLILRRKDVIGPAVGAFNHQGIAGDDLDGFVDGRGLGAQVAGVHQPLPGPAINHQGLRRAEAMPRRMQGDRVIRGFQRFPIRQFDGFGAAEVIVQQDAGAAGQHGTAVAGDVIRMGVGDHRRVALAQRIEPQIHPGQIHPPVKDHVQLNRLAAGCGSGEYSTRPGRGRTVRRAHYERMPRSPGSLFPLSRSQDGGRGRMTIRPYILLPLMLLPLMVISIRSW